MSELLAIDYKNSKPYPARVTGRCGRILHVSRLNAIIVDDFFKRKKGLIPYLIELLFRTGMRPEEAFALTWGDIGDGCSTIHINKAYTTRGKRIKGTKNGKVRTLPCSPRVKKILQTLKPEDCDLNSLIFKNAHNNPFNNDNIEDHWLQGGKAIVANLIEEGKLSHYLKPYSTRATFISMQLHAGFDVKTVAYWVGDKPETILNSYASINEKAVPVDY